MIRFWPTRESRYVFATVALVALAGCTGRSLEGAWYGSFALENGSQCRLRLKGDHSFDVECQGSPKWFGSGKWQSTRESLTLNFDLLTKDKEPVSTKADRMEFTIRPNTTGNELLLDYPGTGLNACQLRREVRR